MFCLVEGDEKMKKNLVLMQVISLTKIYSLERNLENIGLYLSKQIDNESNCKAQDGRRKSMGE